MNMHTSRRILLTVAAIAAVAVVAVVVWRLPPTPSSSVPLAPQAADMSQSQVASSVPPTATKTTPKLTIEAPSASQRLAGPDIVLALADLVGHKAMDTFFQTDDFPRRLVATVDNLGRAHAPAHLWPINPTAGRFTVEERKDGPIIAADNSLRYTAFVLLIETISVERAVDLYVRAYPALQQAFEDLGYPKMYFNDRVLAVINQLLETPDGSYPIKVEQIGRASCRERV